MNNHLQRSPISNYRQTTNRNLPLALRGKRDGWPWSLDPEPMRQASSVDLSCPTISIVVPSLNCGKYIEETLRSIFLQDYPRLQLIVVDGGSTDETAAIINHYKNFIDVIICEPDRGQADAINKGLQLCNGEYFNWINADDILAPNALWDIFSGIATKPDIVASSVGNFFDGDHSVYLEVNNRGLTPENLINGPMELKETRECCFHQPGIWLRRDVLVETGPLNDDMKYIFDVELMIRILAKKRLVYYTNRLSVLFRLRHGSKTVSSHHEFRKEGHFMPIRIFDNPDLVRLHWHQARVLLDRGWAVYVHSVYSRYPSFQLISELISHILRDPFHRLNRFSIGAVKHAIFTMVNQCFTSKCF